MTLHGSETSDVDQTNRSRRHFLAVAGMSLVTGLTGCSGDSDGGASEGDGNRTDDDSDDGGGTDDANGTATGDLSETPESDASTTSDTPEESFSCTKITNGYYEYDGDDGAMFFDIELPAIFEGKTVFHNTDSTQSAQGARKYGPDEKYQLGFTLTISKSGSKTPVQWDEFDRYEETMTVDFEGESRPVYESTEEEVDDEILKFALPEGEETDKRYYGITINTENHGIANEDVTTACQEALNEASRQMVRSVEPASETTFRSG